MLWEGWEGWGPFHILSLRLSLTSSYIAYLIWSWAEGVVFHVEGEACLRLASIALESSEISSCRKLFEMASSAAHASYKMSPRRHRQGCMVEYATCDARDPNVLSIVHSLCFQPSFQPCFQQAADPGPMLISSGSHY